MAPLGRVLVAGMGLVATGAIPAVAAPVPASAPQRPQVLVRRVTTLDAHGHVSHVFGPGSRIQLRIQWTVRGASRGARQTTTWTVLYARHVIVHVVKTAPARNGTWSRITTVTVTRKPNQGSHIFQGRISVDGVSAARSVPFTVHR